MTERKQAELERARYETQLQELAEASLLINSTLSLQKIFKVVTQKARDIIGAHQSIMSTTVNKRWAQTIQHVSLSDKYAAYREFVENHDGSGIYPPVWQVNQPMRMTQAELEEHPIWQGFGKSASQYPPPRGWLAAPLVGGHGHTLGLIQVSDKYEGDFTANDEVLLAQLAQMASVALENVRLYEAEYQVRQLAETLRAANLALTQTLDPKIVLETLLDYLARLIPYDSASVFLLETEFCLTIRASRGYQIPTEATGVNAITFDTRLNSIFQALLLTRQSVLIADTTQHPGWERLVNTEYVRNWLGVPLVAGGQVIGVYGLDKAEPNFFTPEHQRLAEALAAQAAVAIQNAQLFAQVQAGGQRLETLSQRLLEVQEAERRHIARELHDEIGQLLTGLQLVLEVGARSPAVQITSRLNEAQALVRELMDHVHELSLELRPTLLDDLGLLPALLTHFERYIKQTRIQVKFKHSGLAERRFAPKIETAAYRLVQEALTNVARHAKINRVVVSLWSDKDTLQIQVEDQGIGFDPQAALARGTSSGLTGMRERVMLLGGQFIFDSTPGAGACLTAELPLAPEEAV
jgi:signal transduction histidine kinase